MMTSLPEDELLQTNDSQYREKIVRIHDVAREFGEVADLIRGLQGSDPTDYAELLILVTAWQQLLSELPVFAAYARTPERHESLHWLTTRNLQQVQIICRNVREIVLSGEFIELEDEIDGLQQELRGVIRRSRVLNIEGPKGIDDMREVMEPARAALDALQVMRDERQEKEARDVLDSLKEKASEGAVTLDALKRASGAASDDVMSSFYTTLATAETEKADLFRAWTVVLTVTGGLSALIFLFTPPELFYAVANDADRIIRLIQKAIFVAGIFGIAAYLSRQAHQHRVLGNWAKSLSVQLQTFDAYLAAVESPDVRDELRKSFAGRAFGDHPTAKGDPSSTDASTIDAAVGLVAKLLPASKN